MNDHPSANNMNQPGGQSPWEAKPNQGPQPQQGYPQQPSQPYPQQPQGPGQPPQPSPQQPQGPGQPPPIPPTTSGIWTTGPSAALHPTRLPTALRPRLRTATTTTRRRPRRNKPHPAHHDHRHPGDRPGSRGLVGHRQQHQTSRPQHTHTNHHLPQPNSHTAQQDDHIPQPYAQKIQLDTNPVAHHCTGVAQTVRRLQFR